MQQSVKTCKEMLLQRGYSTFDETNATEQIDGPNTIISFKAKKNDSIICVYSHNISKLNKKDLTKYLASMQAENCNHSIIIYVDSITTTMVKALGAAIGITVELFKTKELSFNVTKHRLQPKSFYCLNEKETEDFKQEFGLKIPIMKTNDIICRFFNFPRGSIIEIEKQNGFVEYRIVK